MTKLAEAIALLREIEWRGGLTHEQLQEPRAKCPACGGTRDWVSGGLPAGTPIVWKANHAPDCRLAALIGASPACPHDKGWWPEKYGRNAGKLSCVAGCGKMVSELPAGSYLHTP